MDQFDLFGEIHTIEVPARVEPCSVSVGPDIAFEVLTAVFKGLVGVDGRDKAGLFGPDHAAALAHLQAQDFVRPGKGQQKGKSVLTPRGREKYIRWDSLAPLAGSNGKADRDD